MRIENPRRERSRERRSLRGAQSLAVWIFTSRPSRRLALAASIWPRRSVVSRTRASVLGARLTVAAVDRRRDRESLEVVTEAPPPAAAVAAITASVPEVLLGRSRPRAAARMIDSLARSPLDRRPIAAENIGEFRRPAGKPPPIAHLTARTATRGSRHERRRG